MFFSRSSLRRVYFHHNFSGCSLKALIQVCSLEHLSGFLLKQLFWRFREIPRKMSATKLIFSIVNELSMWAVINDFLGISRIFSEQLFQITFGRMLLVLYDCCLKFFKIPFNPLTHFMLLVYYYTPWTNHRKPKVCWCFQAV